MRQRDGGGGEMGGAVRGGGRGGCISISGRGGVGGLTRGVIN